MELPVRSLRLSSTDDVAWLRSQREDALVDPAFERSVAEILADVRARGDAAVKERTARSDGVELTSLRLDRAELLRIARKCPHDVGVALVEAAENIRAFHDPQMPRPFVLAAGRVGIDGFAGPSEVLIVDDGRADLRLVALDMLAQAEHDPRAIAVCVTTSEAHWKALPDVVEAELARQAQRHDVSVAREAIAKQGAVVLARDLDEAIAFAREHAPEHLEWEADPARAHEVITAGAIFVGAHTPEPVGDYFAGPNHTLPTGGTARFASGLSTTDFLRKQHIIRWDAHDLDAHGRKIATLAHAEGLHAHAASVEERLASRPSSKGRPPDDPTAYVLDAVRRQRAYTLEARRKRR